MQPACLAVSTTIGPGCMPWAFCVSWPCAPGVGARRELFRAGITSPSLCADRQGSCPRWEQVQPGLFQNNLRIECSFCTPSGLICSQCSQAKSVCSQEFWEHFYSITTMVYVCFWHLFPMFPRFFVDTPSKGARPGHGSALMSCAIGMTGGRQPGPRAQPKGRGVGKLFFA